VLTVILGFATALVYGFADFFGAIASRKILAVKVTAISGLVGLLFLLLLSPILGANFSTAAIVWGVAAGFASAIAMSALYASLAIGPISIVSPMSAVISAIVPLIFGFITGDRFGFLGWLALLVILIAVVLVGFVPGENVRLPSTRALLLATIAGTGIGIVLICLAQAPRDTGIASVILLRAVSASLLGIYLLFTWMRTRRTSGESTPASSKFWIAAAVAGLFDSSANVFFTLGSRTGTLSVISVLTALYPLGTIILARVVLKERIAKVQMIGVLLALAGSAVLAVA
jgi:drug/metabolite transporter (DMT)-like permease